MRSVRQDAAADIHQPRGTKCLEIRAARPRHRGRFRTAAKITACSAAYTAAHAPDRCRAPAWSAACGPHRRAARPATPPGHQRQSPRQQSASLSRPSGILCLFRSVRKNHAATGESCRDRNAVAQMQRASSNRHTGSHKAAVLIKNATVSRLTCMNHLATEQAGTHSARSRTSPGPRPVGRRTKGCEPRPDRVRRDGDAVPRSDS
jgi:hypothetical protein